MKIAKKQILEVLKNSYKNSKLTNRINWEINDNKIRATVDEHNIITGFDDGNAFEGWALIIKEAYNKQNKDIKFELSWKRNGKKANVAKYNAFLFRAYSFRGKFEDWFYYKMNEEDEGFINKIDGHNLVNTPNERKNKSINRKKNPEKWLEKQLYENKGVNIARAFNFDEFDEFQKQIPLGVFSKNEGINNIVAKENVLLPRAGRQIDLMGIKNDNMYLIELKTKNSMGKKNAKVGSISEIICYLEIILRIIKGLYVPGYSKGKEAIFKKNMDFYSKLQRIMKINVILLYDEKHPLLTKEIFDVLNKAYNSQNVEFHLLQYEICNNEKCVIKIINKNEGKILVSEYR